MPPTTPAGPRGSRGRLVDDLDRLDLGAVEVDPDPPGLVLDQALAVLHVRIDGRGARARADRAPANPARSRFPRARSRICTRRPAVGKIRPRAACARAACLSPRLPCPAAAARRCRRRWSRATPSGRFPGRRGCATTTAPSRRAPRPRRRCRERDSCSPPIARAQNSKTLRRVISSGRGNPNEKTPGRNPGVGKFGGSSCWSGMTASSCHPAPALCLLSSAP